LLWCFRRRRRRPWRPTTAGTPLSTLVLRGGPRREDRGLGSLLRRRERKVMKK